LSFAFRKSTAAPIALICIQMKPEKQGKPESVTNISAEPHIEEKLSKLLESFSESEVVDLTLIISVMNCMNRMAISFGDKPAARDTSS